MKFFSLFILFFSIFFLQAQEIEFYSGVGINQYYTKPSSGGGFQGRYQIGSSYTSGLGGKIQFIDRSFRISASIEKSTGSAYLSSGGRGGGRIIDGEFNKISLRLNFYPIDIYLMKDRLNVSIGLEIQRVLKEKARGTVLDWGLWPMSRNIRELENISSNHFEETVAGLNIRTGYNLKLTKNWFIVPRYEFYFGLFKEFDGIADDVSSMRHYLLVSLAREF